MEKKQKRLKFQERLDKTLSLPDLVSQDSIKNLVHKQLLCSSTCEKEDVVQRYTTEVSNFLHMLRFPSGNESEVTKTHKTLHKDWKFKEDNDQYRVMYREGPDGSPFHAVLVEGYVDGPIDVCLCVGWETTLFKKWWPQFSVPPFKIITSTPLKKVRIGEEISLVRVKVPWPMTTREAILHHFELEYFQEDLIIVLLNTVSDTEHIDIRTHGFTRDGIPEAKDIVRIDLVGGFVLQKVSSNATYFRTVLNMDMKLEFVPPTLINFITRQLLGNGFKLYRKIVAAAVNGDKDFMKALEGPMYNRVRDGVKSCNEGKDIEGANYEKSKGVLAEEHALEAVQARNPDTNCTLFEEIEEDGSQHMNESSARYFPRPCLVDKESCSSSLEEHAPSVVDNNATNVRGSGRLVESLSANQELLDFEGVANSGFTCQGSISYSNIKDAQKIGNSDGPSDGANENSVALSNVRYDPPLKN